MAEWFHGYWPWWIGGPALSLMVLGTWLLERRIFGVTSHYVGALSPVPQSEELARADESALSAAMLEATLREFGPEAVAEMEAALAAEPASKPEPRLEPVTRRDHLVFLLMLPVGGALATWWSGQWSLTSSLGPLHEHLLGGGLASLSVLVFGGFLTGFGTRMAGGCTSGHGLSGCSRLQPASLSATAAFFGIGVATSFLLEALFR